ncbi:A24 family peptidase [Arthrobacter sp. NPDC093128]|uniref:A24 family peptidase n=1 Tax=Arthrobacter sp. NPDC093128 TaxID=3154979 RepID=UPI00343DDDD7
MSLFADAGSIPPLLIAAVGVLGVAIGLVAEWVVVRTHPRLGGPPAKWVRITTALATGALSALLALRFGIAWQLPGFLVLAALGIQLSRIDIAHKLLPNRIVLSLLLAGAALLSVSAALTPGWGDLLRSVISAAILFIVYLVLAIISPNGIGMGDVKLAAPLGLYLGYLGWGQLFYGGALGFVLGGLATFVLLRIKTKETLSEVAYGPSMLVSCFVVVLTLP